jgi:antitoxin (DNA-binding transcriptional repressor) of toxin-antitoxin stability system
MGVEVAIIGMRALLRDPKAVFQGIEEGGEPILVTNRGRPVAAIYPVDVERAEQLMLAAAPEYVKSRRQAEFALVEGRTQSLEQAIGEYNAGVAEGERIGTKDVAAESPPTVVEAQFSHAAGALPVAELHAIFGAKLADQVVSEADERVFALSKSLVASAEAEGLLEPGRADPEGKRESRQEVIRSLVGPSAELFGAVLRGILLQATRARIAAVEAQSDAVTSGVRNQSMFDKSLADTTLQATETYVAQFNKEILESVPADEAGSLLKTYAASIKGATLFGRLSHVRGTLGPLSQSRR